MNGKCLYRVKWQDFDAKHNSWVQFSDLNKKNVRNMSLICMIEFLQIERVKRNSC
jgi:hypothetical protein